jgi:hypothetical protein
VIEHSLEGLYRKRCASLALRLQNERKLLRTKEKQIDATLLQTPCKF